MHDLAATVWGICAAVSAFAAFRCALAARRDPDDRGKWLMLALAMLVGAVAAGLAVGVVLRVYKPDVALDPAFARSAALLAAVSAGAGSVIRRTRLVGGADAALLAIPLVAVAIYFVAIPGFDHGRSLLTVIFVTNLAALITCAFTTLAGRDRGRRRVGWWLLFACASAASGDGLIAAAAAHEMPRIPGLTASLWTIASASIAIAASVRAPAGAEVEHDFKLSGRRWMLARVVVPLCAVMAIPAVEVGIWLSGDLTSWNGGYFLLFFLLSIVVTVSRQAYLMYENRMALARGRRLSEQVMRRNEELEALTGLATTMTETLEEQPIIERGLDVMRLAARTTSSVLLLEQDGELLEAGTSGDWENERELAGDPAKGMGVEACGDRQVIRLPLVARGESIGRVTLLRPAADRADAAELKLLRLLSDQLAVALQNARDYREKIEQAILDPLTGLLNHRAFQERLGSELARARREGYEVALVALDLDHFKPINDRCGHAVGDEALRAFARTISTSLRASDIAGRVGGDEFMVAMHGTSVVEAQEVVARLRAALAAITVGPTRETLTISAGIAMYPRAAEYQADLMRFADGAMYWSKSRGRDRVSVYAPDSGEALSPEEKAEHAQRSSLIRTVHALARAVDAKDGYTHMHSQRVAFYAATLALSLGLDSERVEMIRTAGVLHDVGKIGIPDRILLKPGRLEPDEAAEMRRHSELGRDIIAGAGMTEIAEWVCRLHERFDGCGYPFGVAGEEIPLESRILAVADALEAMTYARVYRPALPLEDALAELEEAAGSQFDPLVATQLVELVRTGTLQVGDLQLEVQEAV
jgi:diguanylate cyclase (GGDEF)-like protein